MTRRCLAPAVSASLLVATLVAAPSPARADGEEIVAIDVVENTKTNDSTVKLIADVEVGDTFSYDLIDRVRTDLVSSGLFKDVQVIGTPVQGGMKLTIVAKDKHSWVIAPTVYLQPGNQGGGVGFGENNLFGSNKKLLLYGQIATADSLFILGYLDPAFLNSPLYFRADVFLRNENVTEFASRADDDFIGEPEPYRTTTLKYYNGGFLLGLNVWKGFALDGRFRGAWVGYDDPACAEEVLAPTDDCRATPGQEGWDVSVETKVTFDSRANWYGVQRGTMFRLSWEQSIDSLSDFDYWVANVGYTRAIRFFEEHNFITRFAFGFGDNLPFQQEFTSGGTDLRGYQNRQFRGDTKGRLTLEYSVPLFKIGPLAFRGLAFGDLAYTTFLFDDGNTQRTYFAGQDGVYTSQTDVNLNPLRLGLGGGLRIYVRSIVLPLLGVDIGYGPQADSTHVYFAVGLTEL
jgi:outer membrane protein assembly factor BamA